jgi:hypothetical protein
LRDGSANTYHGLGNQVAVILLAAMRAQPAHG